MSFPPKQCVYCGSTGVTKEHIFGSWSRKYGRKDLIKNNHVVVIPDDPFNRNGPWTTTKGALDRDGAPRSSTLKIACTSCNTGWMKTIVDDAIPILLPLSQGVWRPMDATARTRLASWLTLFTMSYEFAHRPTVRVPQSERSLFRHNGFPSEQWRIAVGSAKSFKSDDYVFHRAFNMVSVQSPEYPEDSIPGQATVLTFGGLIALTFYWEAPLELLGFDFDYYFKLRHLSALWPLHDSPIQKPFVTHYDPSIEALAQDFTERLGPAPPAGFRAN